MGIKERNNVAGAGGIVGDGTTITKAYSIGIYQPPAARKANQLIENLSAVAPIKSPPTAAIKIIESVPIPVNSSIQYQSTENANQCEEPLNNQRPRQRRPDRAVYVPRGRRSQTTPPTTTTTVTNPKETEINLPITNSSTSNRHTTVVTATATAIASTQTRYNNNSELIDNNYLGNEHQQEQQPPQFLISIEDPSFKYNCNHINNSAAALHSCEEAYFDTTIAPTNMSSQKINNENQTTANTNNDGIPDARNSDKDYNEEKEFQRASKEINRSNRRIIKQTFNSDVLEINDPIVPSNKPSEANKKTAKQSSKEDDGDDDWESMFDDNGDCLDSKVIDEITAAVGKVEINKPKSDYKMYETPPVNLDAEEFPHVLEVSNFPGEFKTQDLMMLFSQYKETGFDIKWVDDTHALAVFSSSKIATEVLNMGHPFVRLKPLTQSTIDSRAKAKKCALSLQPYRQRPETCAALARRLVTGALGVRLSTAREELENERRVLREAKERKLLAAKLRDEAWEN